MSPDFYHLAHFTGVLMLFLGVGGMLAYSGRGDGPKPSPLFPALHGLGLLVVLVAGIGRAHTVQIGFPGWVWLKICCWLAIGVLPLLARRAGLPRPFGLLLALGLGLAAFWLVQYGRDL